MKNDICMLRTAVSQPILLLLPCSFVTERLREKLCSCLVLHKSHRESLWSTDAQEMRVFPPLPSSPHSRKGLHGHRQRPGVNLPLCCHGNGRAEKKGGSRAVGSYDPME